jgi:DNA topoisomerase-1
VLAAVVTLLELTRLRVGNPEYARLNRSFGLSTLRDRHVTVSGATMRFRFQGKGGRTEERELVDRRLATIVRRCQELPGQDLFQYVDEDGETRTVRSEDVNEYLREAAGSDDVSAKDFRTWTATVLAYRALRQVGAEGAQAGRRRSNPIVEALRLTAESLGDTVAVTRSAYVHPGVLEAFEAADSPTADRPRRGLEGLPDRKTELEVLRLLQRTKRARAARPSQVSRATVAGRSTRGRA